MIMSQRDQEQPYPPSCHHPVRRIPMGLDRMIQSLDSRLRGNDDMSRIASDDK
jgi:hypothetical protein